MNADERTPGQQGYGQQSPQQSQPTGKQQQNPEAQQQQSSQAGQQQSAEQMSEQEQGGSMATGQASYGNSGEADLLSQNSSSMGQDSDLGESNGGLAQDGSQSAGNDVGTSQSGTGGLAQDGRLFGGSEKDMGQSGSQGQDAMNEDLMGSDDSSGMTDIEVERSQGRESDVEGSSF